ncbi:hypothetical protein J6590_049971 [Homalodisca vitripennis]|nr:hypothetical protein J6590_049971 [Homalodisca vitripennis]
MAGVNFLKKVGSGKVYHSQAREIVANVYEYMKNEKESCAAININNVLVRVKAATGVPLTTIKKIVSERKKVIQDNAEFSTPKKNRNRTKPKTDLDNFDMKLISIRLMQPLKPGLTTAMRDVKYQLAKEKD